MCFYGNLVSFEEVCYRSKCVESMNGITRSHAISRCLGVQTGLVHGHGALMFASYVNLGNGTSLSFLFLIHNMLAAMSGIILVAINGVAVWNWQYFVCLQKPHDFPLPQPTAFNDLDILPGAWLPQEHLWLYCVLARLPRIPVKECLLQKFSIALLWVYPLLLQMSLNPLHAALRGREPLSYLIERPWHCLIVHSNSHLTLEIR